MAAGSPPSGVGGSLHGCVTALIKLQPGLLHPGSAGAVIGQRGCRSTGHHGERAAGTDQAGSFPSSRGR
jgi:hypothetical protein